MSARSPIAVAAALVLGLAGAARAESDELTGTVIRRQGVTLEVQDNEGKLVHVRTDGQTRVVGPGDRQLAMADIEKGERLHVTLNPKSGGDRIASEIHVEPVRTDTSRNLGTKPDMRAIPHNPQRSPGEASGLVP